MSDVRPLKPAVGLFCSMLAIILIMSPVAGLSSLLAVYMSQNLQLGEVVASHQFASFIALLFSFSVVGGAYGSRYSYILAVIVGLLVFALGAAFLLFKINIIFALSLVVAGYGFAFPNFIAIFGQTLPDSEEATDSRFVLNYMCMNLGGMLGIGVGMIGKVWFSDQVYFVYMIMFSLISAAFVAWLYPRLPFSKKNVPCLMQDKHGSKLMNILMLIIVLVFSSILLDVGLSHESLANGMLGFITIAAYVYVVLVARKYSIAIRRKVYFFLFLTFVTMVFFMLYAVEPGILAFFIMHHVDKTLFGMQVPASSYFIFNPVFNLIVGGVIIALLLKYTKVPKADSRVYFGLFLMGFAFLVLWFCTKFDSGASFHISSWWIVLVYFFLSAAEMILAPVAYAIVFELGIPELLGVMSGMTQVAIGMGALFSEGLIRITVPSHQIVDRAQGLHFFSHGFGVIAIIWLGIGVFMLLFAVPIRRLILNPPV